MGGIKRLRYSGIVAGLVYWLFVAWSISRNRWFSFFQNALSDLGDPAKASAPWIYNYGLIVGSAFLLLFSFYLIAASNNRLQTIGGAYISISAIFMALIGVFHEGTGPHVFVSVYFFVQFFVGALLYCLGGGRMRGLSVTLFLLAIVGTLVPWPSTALVEAYEIALVMGFTVMMALGNPGEH